jgi:hypothetical protein
MSNGHNKELEEFNEYEEENEFESTFDLFKRINEHYFNIHGQTMVITSETSFLFDIVFVGDLHEYCIMSVSHPYYEFFTNNNCYEEVLNPIGKADGTIINLNLGRTKDAVVILSGNYLKRVTDILYSEFKKISNEDNREKPSENILGLPIDNTVYYVQTLNTYDSHYANDLISPSDANKNKS